MTGISTLIIIAAIMGGVFILIATCSYLYQLKSIKAKPQAMVSTVQLGGQAMQKSKPPINTLTSDRSYGEVIPRVDRRIKESL